MSGALSVTTYGLAHHYLLDDRVASATRQTLSNARVMERVLGDAGTNVGDALSSLSEAQGTVAYLYEGGTWYSAAVSVGESSATSRPASLPLALVKLVAAGTAARQRVVVRGQPAVAVGVPLDHVKGDYFEIQSLSELVTTLDLLAIVLLSCSVATTLGGLVIGRWASRRVMRPLSDIADVAAAISGGALGQRLPPTDDPDLAVLTTTFNDMVQALEDRIKRDARFASDVSHELRSPLTTVQATLELLEASEANLGPDGRKALSLLGGEIRRFSAMVQDLLEMSRFDAGVANLYVEELALDDLVVNTVAAYTGGTVPVIVSRAAVGVWLSADRRLLQRVLVNLLDNARSYAGGAVAVGVDRRGPDAEVTVEDAGPGVPAAERSAIFERFYRGAEAGRRAAGSGTGLGLALVAEHVKAHNGCVEVVDRPGGGARFVIRLPIATGTVPGDG